MKKTLLLFSFCGLAFSQAKSQDSIGNLPKYCILFIGDGFGVSAKTAARMAMGQGKIGKRFTDDPGFKILSLDKLCYNAMVTTHSANSWTTDSGPGASVYSAGENGKIDNEAIAFDVAKGQSVETILEAAKKEGYATGLITTTRITHATPAAFASHTWFRDLEDYIASQYISTNQTEYKAIYNDPQSTLKPYNTERDWKLPAPKVGVEVDVLLGGGFRHFYPNNVKDTIRDANGDPVYSNGNIVTMTGKRIDNVNLINYAKDRDYVYVNSRDALMNLNINPFKNNGDKKLIGLFNASHMAYEQDRQLTNNWEPSLFEMVEVAIKVLKAKGGDKGFFLMVEGGRIDHLEHANNGGIEVVSGPSSNLYNVSADKPVYGPDGEGNYAASPSTARINGVYGSDYLIKEVLAFDYSVAQARNLLNSKNNQTLIFSTSDHECGGTAIVGLHDTYNANNNGTYIRTYALGPKQKGFTAGSGGGPTATTVLTPKNLQRGDIDFGTADPNGWFPNYKTYTFQNRKEKWPKVDTGGRRIVVAYASNPLTNGNGVKSGGTPGNHTPMDIWVGAEDNMNGKFASYITGKGLLDNTYLTPIMASFLGLTYPFSTSANKGYDTDAITETKEIKPLAFNVYPNPAKDQFFLNCTIAAGSNYEVNITTLSGSVVKNITGKSETTLSALPINLSSVPNGVYLANFKTSNSNKEVKSGVLKIIIQH